MFYWDHQSCSRSYSNKNVQYHIYIFIYNPCSKYGLGFRTFFNNQAIMKLIPRFLSKFFTKWINIRVFLDYHKFILEILYLLNTEFQYLDFLKVILFSFCKKKTIKTAWIMADTQTYSTFMCKLQKTAYIKVILVFWMVFIAFALLSFYRWL